MYYCMYSAYAGCSPKKKVCKQGNDEKVKEESV